MSKSTMAENRRNKKFFYTCYPNCIVVNHTRGTKSFLSHLSKQHESIFIQLVAPVSCRHTQQREQVRNFRNKKLLCFSHRAQKMYKQGSAMRQRGLRLNLFSRAVLIGCSRWFEVEASHWQKLLFIIIQRGSTKVHSF